MPGILLPDSPHAQAHVLAGTLIRATSYRAYQQHVAPRDVTFCLAVNKIGHGSSDEGKPVWFCSAKDVVETKVDWPVIAMYRGVCCCAGYSVGIIGSSRMVRRRSSWAVIGW